MKRTLAVIFSMIIMIVVFPVCVGAEEALKAPTVQFKIINHDQVALRWSKIEGADYYYIYRTDVETGKTVRYKKTVEGTNTKISGLSAETDYIFKVAAVSEKNGQITVGKMSRGTNVTTPKEWYYKYSLNPVRYYKENYNKTIREDIELDKIKNISYKMSYNDGWIYFDGIGVTDKDAKIFYYDNDPSSMFIGRYNENKNTYEIICNVPSSDVTWYNYKVYGDYIYVQTGMHSVGAEYYYIQDLYRISLDTKKSVKILSIDDSFSGDFFVKDEYIYYLTDWSSFVIDTDNPYPWERRYYRDKNFEGKDVRYMARVKTDGTGIEILYEMPDISGERYFNNDDLYFYGMGYIYKMSLLNGDLINVCEQPLYTSDFEVVNDYIFFTEYKNYEDQSGHINPIAYYRVKTDGTGLTKNDKPFEWKY